jgi:Zn-dependent peptidase ImmA (M78 family)
MPAPRFSTARRKANEVLRQAKVKRVPVDLSNIATLVGATIHYEPLDNEISGMVTRINAGFAVIGVNSLHAKTRQRFSIAHEIGHLVLHQDEMLHIDSKYQIALRSAQSSMGTDAKEIEANQFAAELLMPREMIEKDVDDLIGQLEIEDAVSELAAKYEVSEQAMTIRLTTLGFLS